MEQRLEHLKKTTAREHNNQKKAYTRVMKESADLLMENNKLRSELKTFRVKHSDLEIALGIKNSKNNNNSRKNSNYNKNREFVDTVIADYTLPLREKDDKIQELEEIIRCLKRQLELNVAEKESNFFK